jgi:hypothetical protein
MCTHLRRIIDSSEATAARTQLPFKALSSSSSCTPHHPPCTHTYMHT